MKTLFNFSLAGVIAAITGSCSSSLKFNSVPLSSALQHEDTYTIIWNGKSEAYRYVNGAYQRDVSYDYQFNVIQKRYNGVWKSIKTLHRLHPDYDFRAGQRSQTMYFEIAFQTREQMKSIALNSSLGKGKGESDKEFREMVLVLELPSSVPYYGISKYAPYNRIKITQHYNYEKGLLTETVELYKEKNGVITQFMKNEETASFYLKGVLDKAPGV